MGITSRRISATAESQLPFDSLPAVVLTPARLEIARPRDVTEDTQAQEQNQHQGQHRPLPDELDLNGQAQPWPPAPRARSDGAAVNAERDCRDPSDRGEAQHYDQHD